jgi:Spy/CpxP family protein refolding chaperone
MNPFIKRAAALAVATTLGATLVMAADGGGPLGGIRERIHNRLVQLGISGEQRDQMREVLRGFLPEVGPLVKQAVQEHRTLRDVIRATPVNEAAIRAQSAKVAAIDAELAVKRALIVEKIRPILTPDQLKEIQQAEERMQSRVDEGLGRLGRWIEGK